MITPKFANGWYRQPSPTQLRQEVQQIYVLLAELKKTLELQAAAIADLTEQVEEIP